MRVSRRTSDKRARLRLLARRRRAARWPGYHGIGDYHGGVYECDFVSPYSKSAGNVDAEVMILLQDWASDDVLRGPVHKPSATRGHDPARRTNIQLKNLLRAHFQLDLAHVFATNVFPFVKSDSMSTRIPKPDLIRAACEFAIPQIEIVRPMIAVCLGVQSFNAIAVAVGHSSVSRIADAIQSPFLLSSTEVWCQAHTGALGTNHRNQGGIDRVTDDWALMASAYKSRRS